jgi:hypothetical protein
MSSLAVNQGTSLQHLKSFMEANAGKDIRAKQDDQGNVTLYARSSWKPSVRFLTQLGDLSGRVAKQDLARSTIKDIMTRQGISPGKADDLLGMCKPGELKATGQRGTGIWIGGKGFDFPGMKNYTGLSFVVSQATKTLPIREQLKDPTLGPILRNGVIRAGSPELVHCLDALNTISEDGGQVQDQQILDFKNRFLPDPDQVESPLLESTASDFKVNTDLMGINSSTSGITGFNRRVDAWQAMPPGNERDAAKQSLLDSLHTKLSDGVAKMIKTDVIGRISDY